MYELYIILGTFFGLRWITTDRINLGAAGLFSYFFYNSILNNVYGTEEKVTILFVVLIITLLIKYIVMINKSKTTSES